MLEGFSTEARRAIVLAQEAARSAGAELIGPVHLLYGLLAVGGRAAERLAGLGLEARAVKAHASAEPQRPQPPPMTPKEAREFRRQLKARGIGAAKAELLVSRIQRQRSTGPVEFDAAALTVLRGRGQDGETSTVTLLRAMFASPPPEVATVTAGAGTTTEAVRGALAAL